MTEKEALERFKVVGQGTNGVILPDDYEKLLNMTDEQAADILENFVIRICGGRGNGKTLLSFSYDIAIRKAIKKLRGE